MKWKIKSKKEFVMCLPQLVYCPPHSFLETASWAVITNNFKQNTKILSFRWMGFVEIYARFVLNVSTHERGILHAKYAGLHKKFQAITTICFKFLDLFWPLSRKMESLNQKKVETSHYLSPDAEYCRQQCFLFIFLAPVPKKWSSKLT